MMDGWSVFDADWFYTGTTGNGLTVSLWWCWVGRRTPNCWSCGTISTTQRPLWVPKGDPSGLDRKIPLASPSPPPPNTSRTSFTNVLTMTLDLDSIEGVYVRLQHRCWRLWPPKGLALLLHLYKLLD